MNLTRYFCTNDINLVQKQLSLVDTVDGDRLVAAQIQYYFQAMHHESHKSEGSGMFVVIWFQVDFKRNSHFLFQINITCKATVITSTRWNTCWRMSVKGHLFSGKEVNVEICFAHFDRKSKFSRTDFRFGTFCNSWFVSQSSCSGSTGTGHCITDWFDGHFYRPHEVAASLGGLIEDNLPVMEHERVFHRKHGVVTLQSLPRPLLESCFGRKYIQNHVTFQYQICFSS